jgi:hypothetical protein
MLEDEKDRNKRRQESMQMLNTLADTLVLTSEHIDRFVSRIVIFKDGGIHFDFAKE